MAEGGALCRACGLRSEGHLAVQRGTLRALEQALRLDLLHLDRLALAPAALAEAQALVSRFQRFHVGVELRSAPVLDALLRPAAPADASSGFATFRAP